MSLVLKITYSDTMILESKDIIESVTLKKGPHLVRKEPIHRNTCKLSHTES